MLSWQYALAAAGALVIAAVTLRVLRVRWDGVAWEAALLFGLYALWQFAGSFTVMGTSGAIPRARLASSRVGLPAPDAGTWSTMKPRSRPGRIRYCRSSARRSASVWNDTRPATMNATRSST